MRNEDYWRQREEEWLARKQAEEIDLERRIRDMYLYLSASIEDEIGAFYQKYANSTGVSYAEAVRRIDSFDVKAFQNKAKKYVETKDFSAKANAELKIYNATMKINRLEMLKSAIGYDCVDTFNELENLFDTTLFKRSTEELDRQAGILGGTLSDNQKLARFIVDGDFNSAHWSDRLWMYQTELKNKISDLLLSGLVQGKHPKELARDITQYAKKNPTINTLRLMRTELARVQTDSQMAAFREMGFESYMFISLEGSPKTCSICAGLDGKVFPVGDTEHLPPQHPNCRCSTAAYSMRSAMKRDEGFYDQYRKEPKQTPAQAYSLDRHDYYAYYDRSIFKHARFRTAGLSPEDYAAAKEKEKCTSVRDKLARLDEMLREGKVSRKIRVEKQNSHIAGTKERSIRVQDEERLGKAKSSEFLPGIDVEKLIDTSGKNKAVDIISDTKACLYFTVDKEIGRVYNISRGEYVKTRRVKVEYSSKGTHAYPVKDW